MPRLRWVVGESVSIGPSSLLRRNRRLPGWRVFYRKGPGQCRAEILDTRAELAGPNTVKLLASGKTVTAERIVIAVGASESA